MTDTYQLKVTLRGTKPPIWRRLLVPGNLNLQRLHHVIQDAMGWEDCHLHSFDVGGEEYGIADPDGWGPEIRNEKQYTLECLAAAKERFRYTYDFGDSWDHEILVEKVIADQQAVPHCVDGARACPPEDCGGVWGFAELLDAIADAKHPRHEELAEWVPAGWSPVHFDLALADRRVAKHRPAQGRARTTTRKRARARV